MMIQLAMKEHDRQTDEPEERVLPASQQTLSDALEDVIDIPGIEVDTEANLTDGTAQQLHNRIQRKITDLTFSE
jgi:NADH dehydrogenase FAD-containing subunit